MHQRPEPQEFSLVQKDGAGFALITTLAILAMLTIMLVAYVSTASSDRQSTHGYSRGMVADEIARGGLDSLVSQLRAEVTDTNDTAKVLFATNGAVAASANFPVYRPLQAAAIGPERMSLLPNDDGLRSIVKVSKPGAPFYTTPAATGTNLASSALTTAKSLNGRSISLARWNRPMLVPAAATNLFPVPAWVLLGRGGPALPGADLSGSLGNPGAVLGRYAYVVYDVSGLIDINVAGYPQGAAPAAGNKGLPTWADLTQLTNSITQPDVDRLVQWRNAANAANYAAYATNVWATNGFMRVAPGDTAFLGRQELIQYAQTQNPDLAAALPYLTTFSREVNGPVWGPSADAPYGAPYDYLTHQYGATTTVKSLPNSYGGITTPSTVYNNNVFILNPRIQTGYLNNFGLARQAGEPLVKYRFPLQKLALLEATTNAAAWARNKAEIWKYFGLDYVTSGTAASSGLYRHWTYPATTSPYNYNGVTNRILTLDEVAKLQRDPNFFELLQAGILSGSLGKGGRTDYSGGTPPSTPDPDVNLGYQLMRIGANIIDQWDADSCPTTITFDTYNFYGTEDLPYINKFLFKPWSATYSTGTSGSLTPLIYFEMWNPHQNLGNVPAAAQPSRFRLTPYTADSYSVMFAYNDPTLGISRWIVQSPTAFNAATATMTFTAKATDYREPSLIFSGSPLLPTSEVLNANPVLAGPGSDRNVPIVGVKLPDVSFPASGTWSSNGTLRKWPPAVTRGWQSEFSSTGMVYLLQYEWPVGSGTYHTYSTLAGLEMSPSDGASRWGLSLGMWCTYTAISSANSYASVKGDPRSARWALSSTPYSSTTDLPRTAGNSLLPSATAVLTNYSQTYGQVALGPSTATVSAPYRLELWAANTNSVSTAPGTSAYYKDMDQVQRAGDAAFAAPSHLPVYGGDASRPVVLNRPFTSVGDLGNAYRDVPWKTLDFFSANSGDAALLDLFTLWDGPVVAGHVNPNAAPVPVLKALLAGADLNATNTAAIPNVSALASAFRGMATNSATGGFFSRADIATKFMGDPSLAGVSASNLKTQREAVIRALAESANTRTWNLMIDLVAQAGRYPDGTTAPEKFVVEGERRYWLHIAIDRYTGEIVDRQLEVVGE